MKGPMTKKKLEEEINELVIRAMNSPGMSHMEVVGTFEYVIFAMKMALANAHRQASEELEHVKDN